MARRLRPPSRSKQLADISDDTVIETDIPARLDRLPWGNFHWLIAVSLGVTWIFNGIEVSLASTLSPTIKLSMNLEDWQVGYAHAAYVGGLVIGALFFGWLTDRLGRKRLFFTTLLIYLFFTALTGLSQGPRSLALFRFLTGVGIGGEYAAINSTIQELIPAKFRGRTDLLISGTFWIGGAIGALGSTVLLTGGIVDPKLGWRVAFLIGAILAIIVLRVRRTIPESPRWLITHNRVEEAKAVVSNIERNFRGQFDATERLPHVHVVGRRRTPLLEVVRTVFVTYPKRALVSFSLMAAQALVYNAVYHTYTLELNDIKYFGISAGAVGWYLLFFAAGNFLGPLMLGRLFDTFGRKRMIAATYLISGVLIAITGYLFMSGILTALTQSLAWMVTFFFASAAASAAYLTAGEIFPLEIRALAIAFFFAVGTSVAVATPWIFANLIQGGRASVYLGYLALSTVMIAAAFIELLWGVKAERIPLEEIARPLTFVD